MQIINLPWLGIEPQLLSMWVRQQTNWADELKVGDNLSALTVQEFSIWLAQPSYEDFTPPTRSHSQHSGCI